MFLLTLSGHKYNPTGVFATGHSFRNSASTFESSLNPTGKQSTTLLQTVDSGRNIQEKEYGLSVLS